MSSMPKRNSSANRPMALSPYLSNPFALLALYPNRPSEASVLADPKTFSTDMMTLFILQIGHAHGQAWLGLRFAVRNSASINTARVRWRLSLPCFLDG
jgi:hypothetical protein